MDYWDIKIEPPVEPTLTTYYNNDGKLVNYIRCARNVERASMLDMLFMLRNEAYLKTLALCVIDWTRYFDLHLNLN